MLGADVRPRGIMGALMTTRARSLPNLHFARNALAVAVSAVVAGHAVAAPAAPEGTADENVVQPTQPEESESANEESPQIPNAQAQKGLEEIVVTARKRTENLQDIPQ